MQRCLPHIKASTANATFFLLLSVVSAGAGPRYSSRIVETKSGAIRGVIVELNSKHLEPVEVFRGVPYAAAPTGEKRFMPPYPPVPWTGTKLADTFPPVCPQRLPDISNKTIAFLSMPRGRYLQLRKLVPLLQNQSEDCLHLNLYVPGSVIPIAGPNSAFWTHNEPTSTAAANRSFLKLKKFPSEAMDEFMLQKRATKGLDALEEKYLLNLAIFYVDSKGNRGLEAPYAVLVFVHGESFEWNSGNPYEGNILTSYGHVIVVTINYRLGILGFLRTRTGPDGPNLSGGNLGVQDIAAALRWIQSNIAAFGGDPKRVTLMGHDTGAALVNLLLLNSSAKNLFHRAVLLSGSILSPWAVVQQPNSLRETVAKQMGCSAGPNGDIAPCLHGSTVDPENAMEHASEAFITRELVLGAATTESYLDFNAADIQFGFEEDQRNRVLRTYVRNTYIYHLNEIFSTVRNEYTDWDKPILHPINIRDSTLEALSDGHTVSPLMRVGYLHARRGAKTYFFHFGYQSKETDYPQRLGSVRGESITYILGLPLVGGLPFFPQNFTKQDVSVAEAVLNFFTNFVKTGDPNEPKSRIASEYGNAKEKSKYSGVVWESYEVQSQQYLSITVKPRMKSHYRGHKMAIWLNLIPQLHQPGDEDVSMRHHHFHERADMYYQGIIQPESLTRPSPRFLPASPQTQLTTLSDCLPNMTEMTLQSGDKDASELNEKEVSEEVGILQRFENSGYHNYAAALGVIVGVGCLFLILNLLIFVGIFYQRGKNRKKRKRNNQYNSEALPEPGTELSQNPIDSAGGAHVIKLHEPPPCYNMVTRNSLIPNSVPKPKQSKPPVPPVKTSSTVKKRVQIQEISV